MTKQIQMNHIPKLASAIVVLLLSANTVYAADLSVDCTTDTCSSSPSGQALFTELDVKPGDAFIREVEACNDSSESLTFALELQDFTDSNPPIGSVMDFTVKNADTNVVLYGPVFLDDLYQSGYILIDGVDANTCQTYVFGVSMANVGNEYQGKSLVFDFGFGFDAIAEITLTPTPTPVPGSVLGEQSTPTPTPVPQSAQTSSEKPGSVLAATGMTLIIPLLVGLFLILSALTVTVQLRNR
ncbi:hypothetical protein COX05_00795 [candidate division WWE3 bacterium CG22_combo_CG10-13_8_21_14_all_39_12]|uniref:Uncharacterized protein n=1 Tax=candidate division WWE3 bacterium CG22_combo_CG10-13_8_21_14_all_39_12 TaxID=1975094 RepID=A0A2H0BH20_UNCKA|nr:MAG: hypothetical protein COX05_00795 [candidate division WWE3 bacterium CG22_combo_CG10-13_8_21_14_all_39_12]